MNTDVIILGARPYNFEDNQTKKQISGVSVWVLPKETDDSNVNGLLPVKYALDKEQYKEIAQIPLPAQAELLLSYNITSKRVKFKAFQNIEPIELA